MKMALLSNISMVILSIIGIVLNGTISFIIMSNRRLRRRKSNKFLLNLLLSDMCVCVSFFCYSVVNISDERMNFDSHMTFAFLISVFMLLSLDNLIVVTLDRLIAVKWSFYYQNKLKAKHVYVTICAAWSITVLYFIILMVVRHSSTILIAFGLVHYSFLSVIIAGFVVMLVTNIIIYVEAKRQLRAISKTFVSATLSKTERGKNMQRHKECRLVRISMSMVLSFVIFWLPSVISCFYMKVQETFLSEEYHYVSWCLVSLNYICDPLIYVALSKDVKTEIKRICRKRDAAMDASYSVESTTVQKDVENLSGIIFQNELAENATTTTTTTTT